MPHRKWFTNFCHLVSLCPTFIIPLLAVTVMDTGMKCSFFSYSKHNSLNFLSQLTEHPSTLARSPLVSFMSSPPSNPSHLNSPTINSSLTVIHFTTSYFSAIKLTPQLSNLSTTQLCNNLTALFDPVWYYIVTGVGVDGGILWWS